MREEKVTFSKVMKVHMWDSHIMSKDAGGANAFVCTRTEHAKALHASSHIPISFLNIKQDR